MTPNTSLPPDEQPAPWEGRVDGADPADLRWHQLVEPWDPHRGAGGFDSVAALVGFRSDEGVRRNHGRVGAAQAPTALRTALGSLAVAPEGPACLLDAGDVVVRDGDLETGQRRLGERISALLDDGALVTVLGGGHETAYASYLGLSGSRAFRERPPRWGILNLDAHFDLRDAPAPSSGTPFLQIARAERTAGRNLVYSVLGISRPNNTRRLFDTAADLGVQHLLDEECVGSTPDEFVSDFLASVDRVYLTIDLDVLPAAVAPGVSAPAGHGVAYETIHRVTRAVAASGKLALADVVELNPRFDVDSRTARAAARLIHTIVTEAADPARRSA